MLGQSNIDDALKQVEKATLFLSKLNKYANFAVATSFLRDGPALISGATEKCSHAKRIKEAEDKKSSFNTRYVISFFCGFIRFANGITEFLKQRIVCNEINSMMPRKSWSKQRILFMSCTTTSILLKEWRSLCTKARHELILSSIP